MQKWHACSAYPLSTLYDLDVPCVSDFTDRLEHSFGTKKWIKNLLKGGLLGQPSIGGYDLLSPFTVLLTIQRKPLLSFEERKILHGLGFSFS